MWVSQANFYLYTFSYQPFRGVLGNDTIGIGIGVMCQVLSEAIQSASEGILEDLDNEDGYMSLKISPDSIVAESTINHCFALGALCTIFMIKAHTAPELISPALIQVVIGPCQSIQGLIYFSSYCGPFANSSQLSPSYS